MENKIYYQLYYTLVSYISIKVEFKTSGAATCNIGFDAFTHCRRKLISSSHHSDSFPFKSALLAFRDRFVGDLRYILLQAPLEVVTLLSYQVEL